MKLFYSLSVVSLLSATLAIPQHNHNDSAENAITSGNIDSVPTDSINSTGDSISTSADPINSSKDSVSIPTDTISSTEQVNSAPTTPVGSSKNNNSKLEDRYLNTFGFDRGYINTNVDATRAVPVQVDNLGTSEIYNCLRVSSSANIRGNRYKHYPHYPPYPSKSTQPNKHYEMPNKLVTHIQPFAPAFD
jgi:hypothetical protein